MSETKNNELPKYLVYNEQNELDVQKTLNAVPETLDESSDFFRRIPDWFEAGADNLNELHEALTAIDTMSEEERQKHTPEEIQEMRNAIERLLACNEMMTKPELSANQKKVLRCICYWLSLEAMNSVPLTDEEAEKIF